MTIGLRPMRSDERCRTRRRTASRSAAPPRPAGSRSSHRPSASASGRTAHVELPAVPDDRLAGRRAEQREQHELADSPSCPNDSRQRRASTCLPVGLHLEEHRRLVAAAGGCRRRSPSSTIDSRNGTRQPHVSNCRAERERQPRITSSERNSPSVAVSGSSSCSSRAARRRVLGDVGRRAAVLAAEREALQQRSAMRIDRRRDADRRVARAARRRAPSPRP